MADQLVMLAIATGVPASVFRLWWIWWKSTVMWLAPGQPCARPFHPLLLDDLLAG